MQAGGSAAPGNTRLNLRDTTPYNKYFPVSRFKNVGGTFEPGKMDNLFQTFTAGGTDWLVLSLEMWPRQAALDWGKQVVASHPSYNVIVSTHAYIDYTGAMPTTGFYGDTNAQAMWSQLISQFANIKFVISGHYGTPPGAYYSEATGAHGNKIAQIMTAYHADYQDHVRLLKIDTAAGTISSSIYVPTSINSAYPSGYIHDQFSDFVTTGMTWIPAAGTPTPSPSPTTTPTPSPTPTPTPTPLPTPPSNLLTNGDFESTTTAMRTYSSKSVLAYINNMVHGGTWSLGITSNFSSTGAAGFNFTGVRNQPAGAVMSGRCYVATTGTSAYKARLRLTELTTAGATIPNNYAEVSATPSTGAWQLLSVNYTKQQAANQIILSGYSNDLTSVNQGSLAFDDCRLTSSL